MKLRVASALLIFLMSTSSLATLRQDASFWSGVDYDTAISETRPIYFDLMLQARLTDSQQTLNALFIRPSLYYKFENRFRVAIGYDMIPTYPDSDPLFFEQRFWPQIQKSYSPNKSSDITLRTRMEYRIRNIERSSAIRFRQRVELAYQLSQTGWIIDVFDELFLGLKKPTWVTQRTVDQNRIFIGFAKKINRYIQLDFGYLSIYRPRIRSRLSHIPLLAIEFGLNKKAVRIQSI